MRKYLLRVVQGLTLSALALALGNSAEAQAPAQAPPIPQLNVVRKDPAFALAAGADEAIRTAESQADEAAKQLEEALQSYEQTRKLEPTVEETTAEAWKRYLRPVLSSGEVVERLYSQLEGSQTELCQRLKDSGAYFNAAALKSRDHAQKAKHKDIKQDYILLAELWEAKAKLAQERANEIEAERGPPDPNAPNLLEYLQEGNLFVRRMIEQVDALDFSVVSRLANSRERLAKHRRIYEQLRAMLRRYHDAAVKKAFDPKVRDAAKKRDAEREGQAKQKRAEAATKEGLRLEQASKERLKAYDEQLSHLLSHGVYGLTKVDDVTALLQLPRDVRRVPRQYERLELAYFDKYGLLHVGGRVAVEWRNDKPYALCLDGTLKPGSLVIAPDSVIPTPPREALERAEEIASRTDPFYKPPAELRAVPPPPPPYLAER